MHAKADELIHHLWDNYYYFCLLMSMCHDLRKALATYSSLTEIPDVLIRTHVAMQWVRTT
jgi:hypothetical protein